MAKRKQDDDSDDSDVSLVDVDFEFFDPNPSVDFIALKRLLTQLFQTDSELFHLHELAELILAQPLLGTTVKTDGKESDPYAFLTILNMHVHKDHPSIKALIAYVLQKASSDASLHSTLKSILDSGSQNSNVGFVFSERLINMPVQVVPPMYRMLADEIKWANDENEPYIFSYYLFISRTYTLPANDEMEDVQPTKRQKKASTSDTGPFTHSFHPEDEYIQRHASNTLDYPFTNAQPREQDSFGLDMAGRLMLVPAERFQSMLDTMTGTFTVPQ